MVYLIQQQLLSEDLFPDIDGHDLENELFTEDLYSSHLLKKVISQYRTRM